MKQANNNVTDNKQEQNINPDNEFHNSVPQDPEIEQPNPSTATPSFPQEIPIREG